MIKIFEDFNEIHDRCKKYNIVNYSINSDGSIDVDGDVCFPEKKITMLPLGFGKVSGDFYCGGNRLSTLEGCPTYVGGNFGCPDNYLTSLEFAPKKVDGLFDCSFNMIESLEGCPNYVGSYFDCAVNRLTSLEGSPNYIGSSVYCSGNKLTSLKGLPKEIQGINFSTNPLPQSILDNIEHIKYIVANQDDYGIWNKDNSFNAVRFDIMMKDKDI